MRCEEVTRELAAPTGLADPAALAGHVASCPGCAEWSRRSARLDRIWDATRPAAPSADAMEALWLGASAALDASKTLRLLDADRARARSRTRGRRWVLAVVGLGVAQAAALLLVTLSAIRRDRAPDRVAVVAPSPSPAPAPAPPRVTAEVDQTLIVRIGPEGHHVDRLEETTVGFSLADATPHDVFSAVESAATR